MIGALQLYRYFSWSLGIDNPFSAYGMIERPDLVRTSNSSMMP